MSRLMIGLIRAYQICLSPFLGSHCRFHPSCSQYTLEAIRKYGTLKGMWFGMRRVGRCHPFTAGGYDPLP